MTEAQKGRQPGLPHKVRYRVDRKTETEIEAFAKTDRKTEIEAAGSDLPRSKARHRPSSRHRKTVREFRDRGLRKDRPKGRDLRKDRQKDRRDATGSTHKGERESKREIIL
jgi:hypothetical protein